MYKKDKFFLVIITLLIICLTYGAVYFVNSTIKNNFEKRNSYYELLEINEYPIAGTDRTIKVVRMMKIQESGVSIQEIDCYTEAGVNQILWRLQK